MPKKTKRHLYGTESTAPARAALKRIMKRFGWNKTVGLNETVVRFEAMTAKGNL